MHFFCAQKFIQKVYTNMLANILAQTLSPGWGLP